MFYSNSAGTLTLPSNMPLQEGVGMTTREQGQEWINLLSQGINVDVRITDPAFLKAEYGMVKNTDGGLHEFIHELGSNV